MSCGLGLASPLYYMDLTQSSTTASVDPDRVSIQYFEKGGANPQKDPIVIVPLFIGKEYCFLTF